MVFGSIVIGGICAAVAAALGAGTAIVWVVAICAALGFGFAALKYDT